MNRKQFKAVLDLLMCADPWPVSGEEGAEGQKVLEDWADEEARKYGYTDWIGAFHKEGDVPRKVGGNREDGMDAREKLAAYAHDAWSRWMKYLFGKGVHHEDVVVIPAESVERWKRQMDTGYSDLPEKEKESDRDEADKMLEIMQGDKAAWNGETCKRCGRDQRLAWGVKDAIWDRAVPEKWRNKVLCLECFLELMDRECNNTAEIKEIIEFLGFAGNKVTGKRGMKMEKLKAKIARKLERAKFSRERLVSGDIHRQKVIEQILEWVQEQIEELER